MVHQPAGVATGDPVSPNQVVIAVARESDVARVVGAAANFCSEQNWPSLLAAHVATAASELANNLWMHSARGGTVRLRVLFDAGRSGIELIAEDDGPGIADIAQAVTEGFSTGGGLGCGLPGVKRLMDGFQVHSTPGVGTRVVAQKWLTLPR